MDRVMWIILGSAWQRAGAKKEIDISMRAGGLAFPGGIAGLTIAVSVGPVIAQTNA